MTRKLLLLTFFLFVMGGGCHKENKSPISPAPSVATAPTAVASPNDTFIDVSQKAGVNLTLGHNGKSPLTALETLGGGCAFLDFNGDDWQDVLLVGPTQVLLFKNNGSGAFTDVTAQSGIRQEGGTWQGAAVGDYDNDGKPDLFISGYRCCALYHNEGGKFREVTKESGISTKLWGTSACFVDIDNDSYLDLVVANYVQFYTDKSTRFCLQGGIMSTCGPTNYEPEKPVLFHSNRNGTFTDETKKRGFDTASGNALGLAIADFDGDGWMDIAIADDQLPGDLFKNQGNGYFKNIGPTSGTDVGVTGLAHAGMGIDWGDYDQCGKLEFVVTTYQHQVTSLYKQKAPDLFADICYTANIGLASEPYVGFGIKFLDYDNDGKLDLMCVNGHAVDNIAKTDKTTDYRQIPQLFHNVGGGRLEEVTKSSGAVFQTPIVGRGLAVGDIDNSGRLSALIMDVEGRPLLLQNNAKNTNHFLTLKLQGTKSNRDAIGAILMIEAGGRRWRQDVSPTGSFLSSHDIRVHIGLGSAKQADKIEVRWTSGLRQTLTNLVGDRFLTLVEGQGVTETGKGK